ncbi:hypothetical protein EDB80DRAFT_879663 [Ilyonectria destructans]|nr:hypothetical protein EDB80DRAFT_879663 [Ilyonectria destructans]
MEQKCLELQIWLNTRTKVIIVVGSKNHQSFNLLLDLESTFGSLETVKVKINVPLRMFGEDPYLLLVRNKSTKDIKQDPAATAISPYQRDIRGTLIKLASNELARHQKKHLLRVYAVFWHPTTPTGLRWENDRDPGPDTFPHEMQAHPAVCFDRNYTKAQLDAFKVIPESDDA